MERKFTGRDLAEFALGEIMVGLGNDTNPRFPTATFKNTLHQIHESTGCLFALQLLVPI